MFSPAMLCLCVLPKRKGRKRGSRLDTHFEWAVRDQQLSHNFYFSLFDFHVPERRFWVKHTLAQLGRSRPIMSFRNIFFNHGKLLSRKSNLARLFSVDRYTFVCFVVCFEAPQRFLLMMN